MKQATTVDQQISLLQERGMYLDMGIEKVKEVLSDIGYFRLGFYCFPFEKTYPNLEDRTHEYKDGTNFSDVVALYYFDVDLRNVLAKYLNRIEINFRTNIVYTVSNTYPTSRTWFVDPYVMDKKFISNFDTELYTSKFKHNPAIRNHHKKYINDKYAPAWKTLEFFTFGAILTIYKSLRDEALRRKIALHYGIRNAGMLENYFNTIVELRNICAHGGVLFDHTLARQLKNGPAFKINKTNKNKLYSAIQIILYILGRISEHRTKDMGNEIERLFRQFDGNVLIKALLRDRSGYDKY
jgi:abortive infection bacteriophage resistance protein